MRLTWPEFCPATLQTNPATSLASLVAAVADAQTVETLQPLMLHVREGQPLQLSVQQVQQMTWQELARLWKASLMPSCMHILSCPVLCYVLLAVICQLCSQVGRWYVTERLAWKVAFLYPISGNQLFGV